MKSIKKKYSTLTIELVKKFNMKDFVRIAFFTMIYNDLQ